LARHCKKVIANDIDENKIKNAKNNLSVYGQSEANVIFFNKDIL
jgi:tRNA G10  N-methylase Trm11